MADQGVSSITNFGLVLIGASVLDARDFGYLSAVYIVYVLLLGGVQSLIGNELVLRGGGPVERLDDARSAAKVTFILSAGCSLLLAFTAVMFGDFHDLLWVLIAALPLLLVQETLRSAAALLRRMDAAFWSDSIWLSTMLGLVALWQDLDEAALLISWAIGGVIACLWLLLPLHLARVTRATTARHVSRSFVGYRFFVEFLLVRASSQGLILLLGAVAGVAATGAFRAVATLLGPLNVVIQAVLNFGAPWLNDAPAHAQRRALGLLSTFMVFAAAAVAVVLVSLPDRWGQAVLGATWAGAQPLLLPLSLQAVALALSAVALVAIRSRAPRGTLYVRFVSSGLTIVGFFAGYAIAGIDGVAWAFLITSVVQCLLFWASYWSLPPRGV